MVGQPIEAEKRKESAPERKQRRKKNKKRENKRIAGQRFIVTLLCDAMPCHAMQCTIPCTRTADCGQTTDAHV